MKKILLTIVLMVVSLAIYAQDPDPDPGVKFNIWQVIGGILFVATMFFSAQVSKVRAKVTDLLFLVKEALELVEYVLAASKDGNFSAVEQVRIQKEAQDVKDAWHRLLGKKI